MMLGIIKNKLLLLISLDLLSNFSILSDSKTIPKIVIRKITATMICGK